MLIIAWFFGGIFRHDSFFTSCKNDEFFLQCDLGVKWRSSQAGGAAVQRTAEVWFTLMTWRSCWAMQETVIIVPGYGLAVARCPACFEGIDREVDAQRHHSEICDSTQLQVVCLVHMNVLLAEAEVPYDQVFEMEDINSEFGSRTWSWSWGRTTW